MTTTSLMASQAPRLAAAAEALMARGHVVTVLPTLAAASAAARKLVPVGASYFTASSETVRHAGLEEALQRENRAHSVRESFARMDYVREQQQMRGLACAPDVVLGSVQAVTLDGELVVASSSGSQLASYAYGAGRLVLLVGAQKVVADLEEAQARITEHCLPREDARARAEYGQASMVNKLLVISAETDTGRSHVLLIEEPVGF